MITNLYEGKVVIDFDQEKHIFWDKNGKRIVGVTSVTGIIDKSRPLMFWAVRLTLDYLRNKWLGNKEAPIITEEDFVIAGKQHTIKKQEAADVGTKIHDWVELWIKGKNPGIPEDPHVMNGVNAFLKWVKETKIKLKNSETIIYSKKHDYAGIMDADGKMGKENVIIDFKSSKSIYNEYRYQLAGYQNAREEETGIKYDGAWLVKFGKDDGEFEATYIPRKEYEKDKVAFLAALSIKRRENELTKEFNENGKPQVRPL